MATIVNVSKTGRKMPLFSLVKGDARTKRVQFVVPREDAGVPLDELIWRISITNAEGETDGTALQKEVHENHIDLFWTCGAVAAKAVGLTTISLNAFSTDGQKQWSSGEYCINVLPKQDDEQMPAEQITELQELIAIAVVDVEEATARANEAAMRAEQMANKNGWLYVEGREDGHLYMITSDNLTGINMKDEEGRLIIVYD